MTQDSATPTTDRWYDDSANIAALLRWLRDQEDGLTLDTAIEVVSKPWHWTEEFEAMMQEVRA